MPILTLQDVKTRLGITDSSRDLELEAVRAGVEEWILDVTGYSLTALSGFTETQQNIRTALRFRTSKRPITTLVSIESKELGGDYSVLSSELLDATKGEVIIIAVGFGGTDVPPVGGQAPWFKWRNKIWPLVRVTYDVAELNPIPADLKSGAIEMTAFISSIPSGGALKSVSVGSISETYADTQNAAALPLATRTMLGRHQRFSAVVVT